jgi:hypothetical protein
MFLLVFQPESFLVNKATSIYTKSWEKKMIYLKTQARWNINKIIVNSDHYNYQI